MYEGQEEHAAAGDREGDGAAAAAAGHPQRGRGVGPGAGGRARAGRPRRRDGARAGRSGTRRCSTRAACSRCSSGTTPATRPRWSQQACGVPPERSSQVCEAVTANSGRDRTTGWVYSVGWTHHSVGRAVHPRLGHHPAAAGQHGPSRRRHPGAARSRQHPGLDRHPDPVQPAARATCRCPRRASTTPCATTSTASASPGMKGFWRRRRRLRGQPAQGLLGRRGHGGERLLLRLPARLTGDHGTYQTVMDMLDGKVEGYFLLRPEPGRRLGARADAAARAWRT